MVGRSHGISYRENAATSRRHISVTHPLSCEAPLPGRTWMQMQPGLKQPQPLSSFFRSAPQKCEPTASLPSVPRGQRQIPSAARDLSPLSGIHRTTTYPRSAVVPLA